MQNVRQPGWLLSEVWQNRNSSAERKRTASSPCLVRRAADSGSPQVKATDERQERADLPSEGSTFQTRRSSASATVSRIQENVTARELQDPSMMHHPLHSQLPAATPRQQPSSRSERFRSWQVEPLGDGKSSAPSQAVTSRKLAIDLALCSTAACSRCCNARPPFLRPLSLVLYLLPEEPFALPPRPRDMTFFPNTKERLAISCKAQLHSFCAVPVGAFSRCAARQ